MAIAFGRYHLLKKLAAGGMGQVYLARKGDPGFEKLVVIKRILPHLVEDEEFFNMFLDEARIAMRLSHPNIAQIFDIGHDRNVHFIEMEYVAGDDVRRIDKRAKALNMKLPLGVTLRVISDAAAGLDHAHKARDSAGKPLNLVHRDVSPQNILVGFDGGVKLIDFGVAKAAGRAQHTATGMLKGKFPYMSPEQAAGEELDPRSDVFALGIVLWEMLTDKRLFKGDSDIVSQKLVKACQVPQPSTINAKLPADLDAIVIKALARKPAGRFADAQAFRLALEEFIRRKGIAASTASVQAFMQDLYADRIAQEANPATHDVLTPEMDPTLAMELGASLQAKASGGTAGKLVVVALGGLVLVGGGIGWAVWKQRSLGPIDVAPVRPSPSASAVAVVPVPSPEPVVDAGVVFAPVVRSFHVETAPRGAVVARGDERLGFTPFDFDIPEAELPTTVSLSLEGYETHGLMINAATTSPVLIELRKKPKQSPRPTNIKIDR